MVPEMVPFRVCAARICSSLRIASRRYSSIAFEYFCKMLGVECPIIWVTKRSETPAALRRLACVWRGLYSQKYSSPAAFNVFAQLLRISLIGWLGVRKLQKTNGEKSGPVISRHLKSSFLHLPDSG